MKPNNIYLWCVLEKLPISKFEILSRQFNLLCVLLRNLLGFDVLSLTLRVPKNT